MTVRVCAAQIDPELGRAAENAGRCAREVREGAAEGARLVVLPEAALTGYVFESAEEALEGAVEADGPELRAVEEACRESGAWAVVGGILREEGRLHNAAFVVGPEGVAGEYRKIHTLCLGVDRFTEPGPGPFPVFDLPFGRVGVHICYDGSFPESARALRLAGAELLLLPTNWPVLELKREMVRLRAEENHVFYLAVNRVGEERGTRFRGGSCAADPRGRLLAEAGDGEERFHLDLDLGRARDSRVVVREGAYEYDRVADRRPECYGALIAPVDPDLRTGGRRRPRD
ncbi:MAG TPA: carbon-nitrogen hydrolase family protein [Gemmatimonadota bacterium]|nr:carbon-nitrogen hydrolase family protein [Gemmatimonadota bacterium]